jgi:hypothetical protein
MTTPLSYTCRRAPVPIVIDGQIEATWDTALPLSFRRNLDGGEPRFSTTARMLWDDDYLYVCYQCQDKDVWATIVERDAPLWEEEVIEIFIDANCDQISYVEIEVNPLNTVVDLFVLNRAGSEPRFLFDWDSCGMMHAVQVQGDVNAHDGRDVGWTAELAIPWGDLVTAPHLPPHPGDVWRANLYRIDQYHGQEELSAWSPTQGPTYHVPQRFAQLIFEG